MSIFCFKECRFSPNTGEVFLTYEVNAHHFTETWHFPLPKVPLNNHQIEAIQHLIPFLHIACGISYFKAFLSETLRINTVSLNQELADFFTMFYVQGLGEFAYRNNIDLQHRIQFPHTSEMQQAISYPLRHLSLIPIGGGKDSLVALAKVEAQQDDILLFSVNTAPPIQNVVTQTKHPYLIINRTLDKHLFALNKQGAPNGHVPITGIIAFATPILAVLYGADRVIMANERAANQGNTVFHGVNINHQWSKSSAFEAAFNRITNTYLLQEFRYISLLRPYSEIAICKEFAHLEQFHPYFTSCNKAYKLQTENRRQGWCGACPKCLFVFLALAPFIKEEKLIAIFGKNLLNDSAHWPLYQELLGFKNIKPFECVGEIEECRAALAYLLTTSWQDYAILTAAKPYITPDKDALKPFLTLENHNLPFPKAYYQEYHIAV